MKPLRRWLGSLFTPADDPRRGVALSMRTTRIDRLLDELRASRNELAQLRAQIEGRAPSTVIAHQLAEEERELAEAESSLLEQLDEQRARAALIRATVVRMRAL
jgi:anion-transporting  ArsA/GET3 family ATPase